MSYRQAAEFLARHTNVTELTNDEGARVAVCPAWQGRVMTSTCDGLDGPSFGFLNRKFIESGTLDPRFNNYGGEDRMWLSPEGGPFSLWFKPQAEQTLDHWYTPAAINEDPWPLVEGKTEQQSCCMSRQMELQNASASAFQLEVTRQVRLISRDDLASLFSAKAVAQMTDDGVKRVGYETANTIANQGPPMTKPEGLVSIWMLGMLNANQHTVILMPYKPGDEAELGPVVKSDYFGEIPSSRLRIHPEAILLWADGRFRSKIGTSPRRARNVLGSIDFSNNVLTIVQFSMPDDPTTCNYMNNMWGAEQAESYLGDVANAYNDGPPEPGKEGLGAFYEIESLSPAMPLATDQSLTHRHRTIHLQAKYATLIELAHEVLGVDLDKIRSAMFPR